MKKQPTLDSIGEVVYVKAKLGSDGDAGVLKKFAIDPNITNYHLFLGLLSKCFQLSSDFSVSYLTANDCGEQSYLPLQSDWDLDAAVSTLSTSTLHVKIEVSKAASDLCDWDIVAPSDVPTHIRRLPCNPPLHATKQEKQVSMFSSLSQRLTQTMVNVQRAIGLKLDASLEAYIQKHPVSDTDFRLCLDGVGRLIQADKFYWGVYRGGLEPSLRKVAWRFLLSVYPGNLSGRERISFMKSTASQYESLKHAWKSAYVDGHLSDSQLSALASVSIDVVRTDWTNTYYKGEQNRFRVCRLFDLLATYCIYHPDVGYNQGMSDLASPLLIVQGEESSAYVCFCALMRRIKGNFCSSHQLGLIAKMRHLHDLVAYTDPHLAHFLHMNGLADMYFTQRWLMLELKREFAFDDCLHLFEAQWAAIELVRVFSQTEATVENETSEHLMTSNRSVVLRQPTEKAYTTSSRSKYRWRDVSLINSLIGSSYVVPLSESRHACSNHVEPMQMPYFNPHPQTHPASPTFDGNCSSTSGVTHSGSFEVDSGRQKLPSITLGSHRSLRADFPNRRQDFQFGSLRLVKRVTRLPPPNQLGHGNPFLLFLCLSLLLDYRESLLASVNEASDILSFYQQRAKRHNVPRILSRARNHFDRYLTVQNWILPE